MSFSDGVSKFTVKSVKEADRIRKAICVELFSSIISDTPVDTGRARGNWQTSDAAPKRNTTTRTDRSGSQAIAEMRANLGAGDVTVTMTNNLPYIEKLEYGGYSTGDYATNKTTRDGYSIKAPEGMVRKNVARVKANIRRRFSS